MITKLKLLKNHQGFMKYFKNTSWLFAEKVVRMFVGLLVGIWLARYLGPGEFGLFSYVQSFVGIFIVVSTLGLDSIVVRELVKDDTKSDILLGTAFMLKLVGAGVAFLLLSFAMFFANNDAYTNLMIIIIASSMIFQAFNVIDFYFQSKVLSKYIVYVNFFSLLLSSLIKVILILYQAPLIAFVCMIVFDNIILSLGYIYVYKKQGYFLGKWRFDRYLAFQMLKDAYPLILAGVINSIYMRIDQVMIQNILDSVHVGYYAAAVKLSEGWYVVGLIVAKSLFPAIVNAKKISYTLYYERIQRLLLFLVAVSYILALFVYFMSDTIILFLYGKAYQLSSNVLVIHIFSAIFVYLGVVSGRWIINENKVKLDLYRNICAMILNIYLNMIWIDKYGIIGAAYASLVAYVFAFYLFDIFLKDTRKMFILKTKALLLWK